MCKAFRIELDQGVHRISRLGARADLSKIKSSGQSRKPTGLPQKMIRVHADHCCEKDLVVMMLLVIGPSHQDLRKKSSMLNRLPYAKAKPISPQGHNCALPAQNIPRSRKSLFLLSVFLCYSPSLLAQATTSTSSRHRIPHFSFDFVLWTFIISWLVGLRSSS